MSAPLQVVVVGQGYVGLPLAIAAAESGCIVTGVDNDSNRVGDLSAGRSPVFDISNDQLNACLRSGQYAIQSSFAKVKDADVVVLCVPTPYKNDAPDLTYITEAATQVGAYMSPGVLVVLESTTYPGTTEEVLLPLLENTSGLVNGKDFELAFSPERIDPGNLNYGIHNTPKIVGGMTDAATRRASDFYGHFVERVIAVSSAAAAEMAKLLENTFRHINIALVNELAILCRDLGLNVWEIIDAAASKPFGFMPFYPGPGVGGHCIPVDPMYLSWRVRQLGGSTKFIELAREINDSMPLYCAGRIQDLLNDRGLALKGSEILVAGVAYKPDVVDVRESPAIELITILRGKGAEVSYIDPHVPHLSLPDGNVLTAIGDGELVDRQYDCTVIVTPHRAFDYERLLLTSSIVFDTRNHLRLSTATQIVRL